MSQSDATVISPLAGMTLKGNNKLMRLYNNPHFDYTTEMLPKNIHDMFKWCEVVYANTPVLVNGIKKLINYPLTDFVYETDSESVRTDTKELLEDKLRLHAHLLQVGLNYYIYGNVFRSIMFPFTRFLQCGKCKEKTNISHATWAFKEYKFTLKCQCGHSGVADVVDMEDKNVENINIIEWDPKCIELKRNPITGSTNYYYNVPGDIVKAIKLGDKNTVQDLPLIFIEAVKHKKAVLMNKSNFYHLKTNSLDGFSTGWGISPLVSTMKLYMFTAILRKSQEAIGLEHIIPQRVVFPQPNGNDPAMSASLLQWRTEMAKSMENWRLDPNYVMMAPFPTGVVNLGSQGRGITPNEEIRLAEENMVRALDLPTEFVFGNTNLQSSPIALRILENQLRPYVTQLVSYINWVVTGVSAFLQKDYARVSLTPFTLADNLMEKQVLLNMMGNGVARSTILESFGINPDDERDKVHQEQVQDFKDAKRLELEKNDINTDVAMQSKEEIASANSGEIPPAAQEKLLQNASQIAQQLLTIPLEQRKSQMHDIQEQDYVLWALVRAILDQMNQAGMNPSSARAAQEQG